jgi:sodium-dependent phosphate cotransporter
MNLINLRLYLGLFFCPLILIILFVLIVNFIKTKKPEILPNLLKTWDFLPEPLRSLKPYDRIIFKYLFCCKCCNKLKQQENRISPEENENTLITKF